MSKEIIMNPDILPTLEEWRLICAMVKQQSELTDEEILKVWNAFERTDNIPILDFARAILKKVSEK